MSTELEKEDLGIETEQILGLMLKGDEIRNGKKVSKFHKREYRRLIKKAGFESLMPRFNKTPEFWKIFAHRTVFWDFVQGDFEMPPYILEEMKKLFDYLYCMIPMVEVCGRKYSCYEVDTLGFSFINALDNSFSEQSKVVKTCASFCEAMESEAVYNRYFESATQLLNYVSRCFSSLHAWVYVAELHAPKRKMLTELEFRYGVTINRKRVEQYRGSDKQRNYYRLETSSASLFRFTHIVANYEGERYPVYIQSHALKRVQERVGVDLRFVTHLILRQVSFRDVRNYRDKILVPLYSDVKLRYKLGYLLGNFKEDRLLIDTFLFISQDGTPEGDKLNELLKINKVEKHFLELDRVEHFVNSSLRDDKELFPIFKTCNLDHLFELYFRKGKESEFTENAGFIKDMLNLDSAALSENLTTAEDLKREFTAV